MITFIVPVKYSSVLNHVSRYNIKIFSFKKGKIFLKEKIVCACFVFLDWWKSVARLQEKKKSFDAVNCLSSKKTTVKD